MNYCAILVLSECKIGISPLLCNILVCAQESKLNICTFARNFNMFFAIVL